MMRCTSASSWPKSASIDRSAARALIGQALNQGKRVLAISNNEFFHYVDMVPHWFETPTQHVLASNRSQGLTLKGGSGHGSFYELRFFALPKDGKPVSFALEKGTFTLPIKPD